MDSRVQGQRLVCADIGEGDGRGWDTFPLSLAPANQPTEQVGGKARRSMLPSVYTFAGLTWIIKLLPTCTFVSILPVPARWALRRVPLPPPTLGQMAVSPLSRQCAEYDKVPLLTSWPHEP